MKASDLLKEPSLPLGPFPLTTVERVYYWRWLRELFPEHTSSNDLALNGNYISTEALAYFDEPERKHVVELHNQTKPEHEQKNTESDQHDHHPPSILFARHHGLAVAS